MVEATHIRLALAQINTTVGAVDENVELAKRWIERASDAGAQLVVLPELCISGYPPEDLLLRSDFLTAVREGIEEVAASVEGIVAVVGFPEPADRAYARFHDPVIDAPLPPAHNSVAVLSGGEVQGTYRKMHLPNYGVFDERRYFEPGIAAATVDVDGAVVGLTVCEDLWVPGPPETEEAESGAHVIVNSSASPYHRGKIAAREAMLAGRARELGAAVALCNTVGGQDELVFDGSSVVIAEDGTILARGRQFEEGLLVCDLLLPAVGEPTADGAPEVSSRQKPVPVIGELRSGARPSGHVEPELAAPLGEEAEVYAALTLGLRDYLSKNGFEHVVLALSGGIDSALVALLAADAVGPERVSAVVMPSPYSRPESQADAHTIASNLGIESIEMPIDRPMQAYAEALAAQFEGTEPGIAEENLQARIRGNLVMALSNKFGWLVLTTGNKSEMSVGYATLYGDMAGGLAVIKDVFKTLVYRLVAWRNETEGRELVPASVLERPPSAELKADQKDEDSLPPYDLLDRILEGYVERDQGPDELVAQGLPQDAVDEIVRLVDRAEYKRRQAPPSIRVSTKAFGRDRRLPITNRFGSMRALPR
ncbi:MAG TPA: NAD+ synthase [Solirubrobacterales bacterium]|nr:NAD+ synthase [Solirubrobacterales bacterium]